MYRGFPRSLLNLLRCPSDGAELAVPTGALPLPDFVLDALLCCATCHREFAVQNGVVCLLDLSTLDAESEHERMQRDDGARTADDSWETSAFNEMELEPTLQAIEP